MTQDELFDQLKHPNPHLRERAMWELADLKDETTIPRRLFVYASRQQLQVLIHKRNLLFHYSMFILLSPQDPDV